jgi:hypothetical protein
MFHEVTSEVEVLDRITQLARRRTEALTAADETTAELHEAVREAGSLVIQGEPVNRSQIIQASGLSRRTAYTLFDPMPGSG